MGIGKRIKWVFIGIPLLVICALLLLRLYFALFPVQPPDVFYGVQPDLVKSPLEEIVSQDLASTMLGNTEYRVNIGTSRYVRNKGEGWDYYYCWIYKRYIEEKFGETWHPFFSRWIPAKEVPSDLWGKGLSEVVFFDESTRRVMFDFGVTNYTCTLPPD